jgi:hypothetical protein
MTRLQIRNLVIANTGRSDKTVVINAKLDSALQEVAKVRRWKSLRANVDLAIVAGDWWVTLASDHSTLLKVRVINGSQSYDLPIKTKGEVDRVFPNPVAEATGMPSICYEDEAKLYFAPKINQSLTLKVDYVRSEELLSFATDSTANPIKHTDRVLECMVTRDLFLSIEQFDSASVWDGMLNRALGLAISKDKESNTRLQMAEAGRAPNEGRFDWTDQAPVFPDVP